MKIQSNIFKSKLVLFLVLLLFTSLNTAYAGPCTSNNWQPTFVHDNDSEDGPWFVLPNGQFEKVRIINNRSWTEHACDLIKQYNVRNKTGYRGCRNYTDIQCGCKRGLSEANTTCANFLAFHNRMYPTSPYMPSQETPNQGTINLLGEMVTTAPDIFSSQTTMPNNTRNNGTANPIQQGSNSFNLENQTISHCPKRNPGSKNSYRFDTNYNPSDKTYMYCFYFKDGVLKSESPYVNGKKHGTNILYREFYGGHPLGHIHNYRNGIKHGIQTETSWCSKGNKKMSYKTAKYLYRNGKQDKSATIRFKSPCAVN